MKYGLIGERLGHSFSKEIHESIANYEYKIQEVAKDKLDDFMKAKDFFGINVTIPYKEKVIPYLDYIDPSAKLIGAVNTIVNKNGKLHGYNTDFLGLRDLILKSKVKIKDQKVLILGNGGTSKTAQAVFKSLEAGIVKVVSLEPTGDEISYQDAVELHNDAQIILNATPVGMYPNNQDLIIDIDCFNNLKGVFDVVYNPLKTKLIQKAKAKGIKAHGGLYMLVAQAVYASCIFRDVEIEQNVINEIYTKIRREKRNIVLIGMPSCGKSTIGKSLAKKLNKTFVDIDREIEKEIGTSIKTFIELSGEEAFRKLETEVTYKFSKLNNQVIATGGGVIKRPINLENLKQNGKIIFIDRPLDLLKPTTSRPLSNDPDKLRQLYSERYDIYMRNADLVIKNDEEFEECVYKLYHEVK